MKEKLKKGEARFKISEVLTTDTKFFPQFDEDKHCVNAFITWPLNYTKQEGCATEESEATAKRRRKQPQPSRTISINNEEDPASTGTISINNEEDPATCSTTKTTTRGQKKRKKLQQKT